MDIELPNGTVIQDIPEGTSKADIMAKAIKAGLATQADFGMESQTQQRSMGEEVGRQIGLTGRALYEGFTAPATAALEFGRGLYNIGANLVGSESRIPSIAQAQSQLLTQAGVPQPETMTERAAQAGAQAMVGTGALSKIPGMVTNIAKEIPVAGISAFMSQPAAEVVKDYTGSDLAATLAAIGTAGVTAGYAGRAMNAMEKGKPLFTMDEVKKRAASSYREMDNSGVAIKPQSVLSMLGDAKQALDDARMIPGTDQAKTVTASLKQMENIVGQGDVSFTKLEKLRQIGNDLKGNSDKDIGRLGSVLVDKIDNYISSLTGKDLIAGKQGLDEAVKNLTSARKDWRNAARASVLEDALNVAEIKAYAPNTSESELIRRGFINIASNKQKMNLFTPEEQNIIKGVAKGGSFDSVLSFMGQFNPARSKLSAAAYGLGATQNPTVAAALAGGGFAADTVQGLLRRRAAQLAANTIASGAAGPKAPNLAYRGLFTTGLVPPDLEQ